MADSSGRVDRWAQSWSENRTSWHMSKVNPQLMKWCHKLAPDDKPTKFLIPLCGKTLDMIWLYQKGHTVIGIEAVEQGIIEFFTENNLQYTKQPTGNGQLYQTPDGRLQIYQADICEISADLTGKVGAIWDRGSYVAINREDRKTYAKFMKDVMEKHCHWLLWSLEYDTSLFSGPPRSLTEDEIKEDLGSGVKIECLSREHQTLETFPKMQNWNLTEMIETVYLITRK